MYYTERSQNIDIYFREIRGAKSLTREDEVDLFNRIALGDVNAQNEIIKRMALYAVSVAKEYTGDSFLLEDLIQEANIGLLDAIHKYDLSTGNRFSSYAVFWMKAYINKFLSKSGQVNATANKFDSKVKKIKEDFYKENDREITEGELMDILQEMGEPVSDILAVTDIKMNSINDEMDDEDRDGSEYGEVADRTATLNEYEDEIDRDSMEYKVSVLLSKLDDRSRNLVKMKFGIGYEYPMDDTNLIAERWNAKHPARTITGERVRQIINTAIKMMGEIYED